MDNIINWSEPTSDWISHVFSGLQTGPRPTLFSITNEANAGPISGLRPDYMTSPTNIFSQLNTNICKQAWSGPKFLARALWSAIGPEN